MQFDFDRFSTIAASVYNQGNPYSLEECLEVFCLYFQTYEEYMGHPHPPIRASQIARIMADMPFSGRHKQIVTAFMKQQEEMLNDTIPDIDQSIYPLLIKLHFKTRYHRCDYNINHFFSGKIRELRLYEVNAGYR